VPRSGRRPEIGIEGEGGGGGWQQMRSRSTFGVGGDNAGRKIVKDAKDSMTLLQCYSKACRE